MSECLNSSLHYFDNKKLVMEVMCEHMMMLSDHYQRMLLWAICGTSFQKIFLRLTKEKIKPEKIKTNSI